MSRSAKKKHARKLKKAKNDRKALARLQGTLKIRNKEVDFSEGLVKESASKWGTDTAMDIGDAVQVVTPMEIDGKKSTKKLGSAHKKLSEADAIKVQKQMKKLQNRVKTQKKRLRKKRKT